MPFATLDIRTRALEKDLREHLPISHYRFLEDYQEKISGVLIPAKEVKDAITDAARAIAQQYLNQDINQVVAMYVLKGAREFYSEMRQSLFEFGLRTIEDVIGVSRYEKGLQGGLPRISVPETEAQAGDHILIVEDIVDEGLTLEYIIEHLRLLNPASVRSCSLLLKPGKYKSKMEIDFPLFSIDDHWVVGKGMDLTDENRRSVCRDLPFIGAADPDFLLRTGQITAEKAGYLRKLILYARKE